MRLNKRRTALEVLQAILNVVPATRTDVRMAVGMNYSQAERYMVFLVDGGYLESRKLDRATRYFITGKGQRLLALLAEVSELVDSEDELATVETNGHLLS